MPGRGGRRAVSGLGIQNQPHQQVANRTAFLKGRQDTNIANIAALQSFIAGFTGSLKTNGYLKIPLTDVSRGAVIAIIQWGYYALSQQAIPNDTQYTVAWPITFPNAILLPPLATNVYYSTGGGNIAVSVISYGVSGVIRARRSGDADERAGLPSEQSNGFSWLAIGF